ncbi:hypothetical protein diail_2716 [Diaporthe ilicicola]|nr:hypothetical protein diail_2716 [Diaporthe ilicicola]
MTSSLRQSLGPSTYPTALANKVAADRSRTRNLASSDVGSLKYSLEFLLQFQKVHVREQYKPAQPIISDLNHVPRGTRSGVSPGTIAIEDGVHICSPQENHTDSGTVTYVSLPAEVRQIVLRELVPTRSIWNGTSFPKSWPERYQQTYFENTRVDPPDDAPHGRPEDAWGRNESAVESLLNARLVSRMFSRDIDAFFSHECTYWLTMGATEFFLFKCLAFGTRHHHLFPRHANSFPTCRGDQISCGYKDEYKGPSWHHNNLSVSRLWWKDIVESRWDRGPHRPGYLKFIGRFRNLRIVCFMGHSPDAYETVTTIFNGIFAKPAWRDWEAPRFPKVHFTFHHYVGYHCRYLCPECEGACSAHRLLPNAPEWIDQFHCTSMGMGRESWFSTCPGCVNCLGSTDYISISLSNHGGFHLAWSPRLNRMGPSFYNLEHVDKQLVTSYTDVDHVLDPWDDPVRAQMLRTSPGYTLDPDAAKQPIQPMYGKEGLVDAWQMWNKWAPNAWDRHTFAIHHEHVGFFWSRTFPDTTRAKFWSQMLYSDPLIPGRKYRLKFTGQFVGRHNAMPLVCGRDVEEEEAFAPRADEKSEDQQSETADE